MKKYPFYLLAAMGAMASNVYAQSLTWNFPFGTSIGLQDTITDMAVDSSGNCYIVGHQFDSVNSDAMIGCVNSAGSPQYYKRYEQTFMDTMSWENEKYYSVAVNGGSVYALGTQYNGTNDDILLMKYTPAGVVTWTRSYDAGAKDEPGKGLAVDGSGNMYILFTRTAGASTSLRMAKYTTAGSRTWVKTFSLPGGAQGDRLKFDPVSNHLYAVSLATSGWNLSKIDLNGNVIWTTSVAAGWVNDLQVDSSGNIVLAMTTTGGTPHLQLSKYNSSGSLSWSYSTGFTAGDIYAHSLTTDSSNNVYVGGYRLAGGGWNSIITSVDSSGAYRFQLEENTYQFQVNYKIGIGPDGNLYSAYCYNPISGPGSYSITSIRKISPSGVLLAERSSTYTTTNWCYTLGFDSVGGVYAAGGLYNTGGDLKPYIGKF